MSHGGARIGRWGVGALCALLLVTAGCGGDKLRAADSTRSVGPLSGEPVPVFSLQPTADALPAVASGETDAGGSTAAASQPRLPTPSEGAQLARLVIPKARVNNRLVVKGLNERREMEDPGSKDDVAWYNFSTLPGFGSNAVMSGHVDWYTGDRGSFWFLRDLKDGDDVEVQYSDGFSLKYRVVRVDVYSVNDAPVAEITGPTATDRLTMITCEGVFQRATGDYNRRRVVVAERYG